MNLWDEVPEARQWYESVAASVEALKWFEAEEFASLAQVVLSTSGVDSQREALSLQALGKMVDQVSSRPPWVCMGADHDPLVQTIGRIVAARLFYAPQSELHFIAAVVGIYDPAKSKTFEDLGVDVSTLSSTDALESPIDVCGQMQLAFSPHEIEPELIDELLADAPDVISRKPIRSIRKAAEPIVILGFMASVPILAFLYSFGKSFGEGFGKRLGENAADAVSSWVASAFAKVASLVGRKALLVFYSEYRGCDLQFVVDSSETAVVCEASRTVDAAARSAASLIDRLHDQDLVKLVYAFDLSTQRWLPLHAMSRKVGVICDRPYLIDIEQRMGISVGGVIPEE
jgi:hypothetical protein